MPFTVIKGTFHVRGYSPDGDSIRFEPADPNLVHDLDGFTPRFNARNHVQLRIEAIDSLETHYNIPSGGGMVHQPMELAKQAAAHLLNFVGITDVEWNNGGKAITNAADGTTGYILARSVEKNGRPVAFVFAGDTNAQDGDSVYFDANWLEESYNYLSLLEGNSYPTYYEGLFSDLREKLTDATRQARANGAGIFASDRTNQGFNGNSLQGITNDFPVLPKLFRRLSEYLVNVGSVQGFKEKLALSKEPVLDLTRMNFTHFDTFVEEQAEGTIRLTRRPEELVFDAMPTRPRHGFSAIIANLAAPALDTVARVQPAKSILFDSWV